LQNGEISGEEFSELVGNSKAKTPSKKTKKKAEKKASKR
jgi:hypothetical protein